MLTQQHVPNEAFYSGVGLHCFLGIYFKFHTPFYKKNPTFFGVRASEVPQGMCYLRVRASDVPQEMYYLGVRASDVPQGMRYLGVSASDMPQGMHYLGVRAFDGPITFECMLIPGFAMHPST